MQFSTFATIFPLFLSLNLANSYLHQEHRHLSARNPYAAPERYVQDVEILALIRRDNFLPRPRTIQSVNVPVLNRRELVARARQKPDLHLSNLPPQSAPTWGQVESKGAQKGMSGSQPAAVQPPATKPPKNMKDYHQGQAAHHGQQKQNLQNMGVQMPDPKNYPKSGPINHSDMRGYTDDPRELNYTPPPHRPVPISPVNSWSPPHSSQYSPISSGCRS